MSGWCRIVLVCVEAYHVVLCQMLWRNLGWQCLLVFLYRILVGSCWLLWSAGFRKNIRTWNHGLNLLVSYFSPGVLGDVCK
jgi:hypothetical protein